MGLITITLSRNCKWQYIYIIGHVSTTTLATGRMTPLIIIFNVELMLGLNYIHVIELELLCCVQVSHDIFLESLYRMYVNVQYGAHIQSIYWH